MVIRHAEKPEGSIQGVDIDGNDGPENLVVQGWQRAGALARFFAPLNSQFQHAGSHSRSSCSLPVPSAGRKKRKMAMGQRASAPNRRR